MTGDLLANIPPSVEFVSTLVDGQPVSGYEHCWSVDHRGRMWIRKQETSVGVQPIAAEIIGWRLGRILGVPLPAAAYYDNPNQPGSLSWLSQAVLPPVHWNPEHVGYIRNLEDLGNILVLDILIFDQDRHAGNLLLQQLPDSQQLRLWAIDSGNALVAYPTDYPEVGIPGPMRAPGIPYDRIADRARQVAQQAMHLGADVVGHIVQEAYRITELSGAEHIAVRLLQRCMCAVDLVSSYLDVVLS